MVATLVEQQEPVLARLNYTGLVRPPRNSTSGYLDGRSTLSRTHPWTVWDTDTTEQQRVDISVCVCVSPEEQLDYKRDSQGMTEWVKAIGCNSYYSLLPLLSGTWFDPHSDMTDETFLWMTLTLRTDGSSFKIFSLKKRLLINPTEKDKSYILNILIN